MKPSTLFSLLAPLGVSLVGVVAQGANTSVKDTILANAAADGIDLTVLDFLDSAISEITSAYQLINTTTDDAITHRRNLRFMQRGAPDPNNIVDVHTHVVPSWYKTLVPTTAGIVTPDWDLTSYLSFMAGEGIDHSIFSFSTPGANVFLGNKVLTVALARLINEQSAAYHRVYPNKLDFYAIMPLPHTVEAIREAKYAIKTLGAVGLFLFSNFEGMYLGNPQLGPFFEAYNKLGSKQILYVHPAIPYLKVNNKLVEANPTTYLTGKVEFFFETARTFMDLTLTQTIHNFTNIHYVIPHVGGAFPSIIDRVLKSMDPAIYNSSLNIYSTRFWWDSAGPTYYHQVAGLLGFDIPKSQLLFGSDFPYVPTFTQAGSLEAVKDSGLFTAVEKGAIFRTNAAGLFAGKIAF